jgi:photoactive yellow protein
VDPMSFDKSDVERLLAMGSAEFNALPYGVIRLDATGRVLAYNNTEGEIAGYAPRDVVGRNFFLDIAPCTNTSKFRGQFQEGVARGELNVTFEYLFTNQARSSVWVHMLKGNDEDYWLLVTRA